MAALSLYQRELRKRSCAGILFWPGHDLARMANPCAGDWLAQRYPSSPVRRQTSLQSFPTWLPAEQLTAIHPRLLLAGLEDQQVPVRVFIEGTNRSLFLNAMGLDFTQQQCRWLVLASGL